MTDPPRRWPWVALAAIGLALILRLTLTPTSESDTGTFRLCVLCGDFGLSDFIANIVLFVPVAAALHFAGLSAWRIVVGLFVLSVAIELAQLRIPGRESALGDIVSNTMGAAVGVGLARWWPRRRRSGPGALALVAVALGAIACAGLILRPRFPATVYWGQWTAELGGYDAYRGRVLSAEIGGMQLPSWELADSRSVRERLVNGEPLVVRAVAGPRPRRLAPLFSIADDRQRGILLLGVDREDLVFVVSTSATDLRLHQPALRWSGAMVDVPAGDTLVVEVRRTPEGYCLGVNSRERCGLGHTTGEAMGGLVQYFPHMPPGARRVLDGVLMALLGLAVGLLAPRRAAGWLAVAALLLGAVLVPPLVGLATGSPLELAAIALGVVAGGLVPVGAGHSGRSPVGGLPR